MSATTATANKPKAQDKPTASPQAPAPTSGTGATLSGTNVEFSKANVTVFLPFKFKAGEPMTADHVNILHTAFTRQLTNNLNANADARAKRLAKATTDADKAANAPYTADEILKVWADYMPTVGDTPRLGTVERMQLEAGWKALSKITAEHNADPALGIIPSAKGKVVRFGPDKAKLSGDAYKAAMKEWQDTGREALVNTLKTRAWLVDRIAAEYDAMVAAKKAEKPAAVAVPDDMTMSADSL